MLTDQELQSLRNQGNEGEAAADEIERLRLALDAKDQMAQSLARTVMADHTSHDTTGHDAARLRMLLDGEHELGVFVCDKNGNPCDSVSAAEVLQRLDALLEA
jgi:hypothetical protein